MKLDSRSMFDTINNFLDFENMVRKLMFNEHCRLFLEKLFYRNAMKKSFLNIQLSTGPTKGKSERQNKTNG